MPAPTPARLDLDRRSLFRAAGALTLLVGGGAALAACGDSSSGATSTSKKLTLTVGQELTTPTAGYDASGVFDDAPYAIRYAKFKSPTETLTALASGKIDVANNDALWTATQADAAASQVWTDDTVPYRNVLLSQPGDPEHFSRFVIAASAGSGIRSIEQAKGRKWGILPGSSLELFAYKTLDKLGWSKDDVTFVNLTSSNQGLALTSNQVDIEFVPIDVVSAAIDAGAQVIGTAYDYGLTIYTGTMAGAAALADQQKSDAIADYVGRMVEYQNWYVENPDKVKDALVKGQMLTAEQAEASWQYNRALPGVPDAKAVAYSQSLADFALDRGLITKKVDASVLLEDRYATQITKALTSTDLVAHLAASSAS